MRELIPVCSPKLPSLTEIQPYIKRIDDSRIYSNRGPLVTELEQNYAQYFGLDPSVVVAVVNATIALQGLVEVSDPQKWVVPGFTFAATGLAVRESGKDLWLCDVDAETWKLDRAYVDKFVGDETVGYVPVMPFGAEVDFRHWRSYKHVVFDAAASLGATRPDFSLMSPDWAVVYSLHATKVLPAGEGALVLCGSQALAAQLRSWINFGFRGQRFSETRGTNGKMSEISAAYALASWEGLDAEKHSWRIPLDAVAKLAKENDLCNVTTMNPGFFPYWIVRCRDEQSLKVLQDLLSESGVESRCWWPRALDEMPSFSSCVRLSCGELAVSRELSRSVIGLPMYRDLPLQTVEHIFNTIMRKKQ